MQSGELIMSVLFLGLGLESLVSLGWYAQRGGVLGNLGGAGTCSSILDRLTMGEDLLTTRKMKGDNH